MNYFGTIKHVHDPTTIPNKAQEKRRNIQYQKKRKIQFEGRSRNEKEREIYIYLEIISKYDQIMVHKKIRHDSYNKIYMKEDHPTNHIESLI